MRGGGLKVALRVKCESHFVLRHHGIRDQLNGFVKVQNGLVILMNLFIGDTQKVLRMRNQRILCHNTLEQGIAVVSLAFFDSQIGVVQIVGNPDVKFWILTFRGGLGAEEAMYPRARSFSTLCGSSDVAVVSGALAPARLPKRSSCMVMRTAASLFFSATKYACSRGPALGRTVPAEEL